MEENKDHVMRMSLLRASCDEKKAENAQLLRDNHALSEKVSFLSLIFRKRVCIQKVSSSVLRRHYSKNIIIRKVSVFR